MLPLLAEEDAIGKSSWKIFLLSITYNWEKNQTIYFFQSFISIILPRKWIEINMFAQPGQSAPRAQEPVPANWANSIKNLTETGDKVVASFPIKNAKKVRVEIVKDGTEFYSITFDNGRMLVNLDIYDLANKLCEIEADPGKYC